MSQVDELLEPLVAGTRDEFGCLGFRVLRADEPGEIVLLSEWDSEDALNAHFATTHYRYYAENVGPLLSRASDVVIHHVSSTVHPIDSGWGRTRGRSAEPSGAREPPLQKPPLGVVDDELQRAGVGGTRIRVATDAAQQLGARGVEVVVAVEVELDRSDPAHVRVAGLRNRDRAVERDDGRAGQSRQRSVERRDLRPVARLIGVQRRDRRLDGVWAVTEETQRPVEREAAGVDLVRVPPRRVLVGQQDELAVAVHRPRAARSAAAASSPTAVNLRLVGHQLGQRPAEPDRVVGQLVSGRRSPG